MRKREILIFAISLTALLLLAPIKLRTGVVSITLQTLVIFLIAAINGVRNSGVLVGIYLLVGALGLPVFAGHSAGFEKLIGPTAGFLWGFLPIALFVSWRCNSGEKSFFHFMVYFFQAHILLLIPGFLVLYYALEGVDIWGTLIRLLPGLLIKSIIGGLLAYWIKERLLPEETEAL